MLNHVESSFGRFGHLLESYPDVSTCACLFMVRNGCAIRNSQEAHPDLVLVLGGERRTGEVRHVSWELWEVKNKLLLYARL